MTCTYQDSGQPPYTAHSEQGFPYFFHILHYVMIREAENEGHDQIA